MFIVVFVIMLPIYLATKDPLVAWAAGLAWCFIIGLIVLVGAFVGPYIRRYTPQAAMLGTLAGISIAFISMRPAAQMWEALWIALPVMMIILIGFFTDLKLPGNIPVGLAALLVGTAIGWIGGYMSAPDVVSAAQNVAISLPTADFARLGAGLADVAPLPGHGDPAGHLQLHRGHDQRRERGGGGRRVQPPLDPAGRRHRRGRGLRARLPVPARRLHRTPRAGRPRAGAPATRSRPAS
jgi:AGZA family xanthine/uracil permease-like MFS transporter